MLGFELLDHLTHRMTGPVMGISRRAIPMEKPGLRNQVCDDPLLPDWLPQADKDSTIIHCAGLSNPRKYFDNMASLAAQEIAPHLAMVEGLVEKGWLGHLVFLSSGGAVYGDVSTLPIVETAPRLPKGHYGLQKLILEDSLAFLARRHGFRLTILRVGNPYGATIRKREQGVIPVIIDASLEGTPFQMFGDGRALRDYVHVKDFCVAVEKASLRTAGATTETFNIGSGTGTSLRDLIDLVTAITGKAISCAIHPTDVDVTSNVLDISKAKRALDWTPVIGIKAGVQQLILKAQQRQTI
jgi:UDP-glucose 4-epimerase